jgi:hypothetical protein
MDKPTLGKLEKVDLRTFWENEAQEFTPWLAQAENIKLLGDAVGLELEVEAEEKDVGPFRADILCKDTDTNNWVIIENQLEPTNHSHLGQLLTYAAGLQASAIIWIAEEFRPEHRAALDWLNDMTREGAAFYGVEIELLRIGSSPLAPRFNVVSKPNEFSKEVQSGASPGEGELSDVKRTQLEFWTAFRDYLKSQSKIVRPQSPRPQHWMTHSVGVAGSMLSSVASSWDSETGQPGLRAELVLNGPRAKSQFQAFEKTKPEIEKEAGEGLVWENHPDTQRCKIYFRRSGDIADKSKWPEFEEWLKGRLEALRTTFGKRLKDLQASNAQLKEDEP